MEILDKGSKAETKNYAASGFTLKITYQQEERDELDQLRKVDEIKELFGMIFKVGERDLTVGEYSYDFIGEYSDILQINIDINCKENTQKENTAEIAENVNISIIGKG